MDQELFNKVWGYLKFNELSPKAAKKAIQNEKLFRQELPWGKVMDPQTETHLFHPDGRMVQLTTVERETNFPIN